MQAKVYFIVLVKKRSDTLYFIVALSHFYPHMLILENSNRWTKISKTNRNRYIKPKQLSCLYRTIHGIFSYSFIYLALLTAGDLSRYPHFEWNPNVKNDFLIRKQMIKMIEWIFSKNFSIEENSSLFWVFVSKLMRLFDNGNDLRLFSILKRSFKIISFECHFDRMFEKKKDSNKCN